jgi:serine/threonine-protein kinase HipA
MTDRTTALESLRRVLVADVFKKGRHAATLTRRVDGTELRYETGYDGPPIASTLPVSAEPILSPAGAVPPFFAGLLPEGRRLVALQRAVKTSADDDLSLLLAVGRDTVGDVQVVPAGEAPILPEPLVSEREFGALRFEELFVGATGGRGSIDRVALPGVQDKVSASRMLSFPLGVGGSQYILKLSPREFPHLVENEAFFLDRARRCGLDVAQAEVVHDAAGARGLLVRRFDRETTKAGTIELLTQEDGCQACGRYPADKYNLASELVVAVLASLAPAARVAARELVRQVAFAYLTGNGDMHAKNLSVVERHGELRAAPAYDIPSTYPYGDTTMAMTVDGRDPENITRASFVALAGAVGVPPKAATAMLDDLLARFPVVIDELDELPFDARLRHRMRRLMLDRARKLA